MTGRRNEEGAILLLVLVIVTVIGIATLAIAELAFATPKAAKAFSARERLVNALDIGLAAEIETVRLSAATEESSCPVPVLRLGDADGLRTDGPPAVKAITVQVCTAPAGASGLYRFVVKGYMVQEVECPSSPPAATLDSPYLEATVLLSTTYGVATPKIARTTSRRLVDVARCAAP